MTICMIPSYKSREVFSAKGEKKSLARSQRKLAEWESKLIAPSRPLSHPQRASTSFTTISPLTIDWLLRALRILWRIPRSVLHTPSFHRIPLKDVRQCTENWLYSKNLGHLLGYWKLKKKKTGCSAKRGSPVLRVNDAQYACLMVFSTRLISICHHGDQG